MNTEHISNHTSSNNMEISIIEKNGSYHLILLYLEHTLQYSIFDLKNNTYVLVKNIDLSTNGIKENQLESIKNIFIKDELLRFNYKSVQFIVNNQKACIIPNSFYSSNDNYTNLIFTHQLNDKENIRNNHLKLLDADVVFSIERSLEALVKVYFPNVFIHHTSGILIENALVNYGSNEENFMIIVADKFKFDTVILKNGKFIFYNQFSYSNNDEFIYYSLLTLKELKLEDKNVKMIVYGDLDNESDLIKTLLRYIKNVTCGSRNPLFNYHEQLSSLNPSLYYYLFNSYQCE